MTDEMSQPWAPPSCLAYQFSAEINVSSAFQRNGNEKASKGGRITWDPDEQDKIPVLLMRIPPLSPGCGKETAWAKFTGKFLKTSFHWNTGITNSQPKYLNISEGMYSSSAKDKGPCLLSPRIHSVKRLKIITLAFKIYKIANSRHIWFLKISILIQYLKEASVTWPMLFTPFTTCLFWDRIHATPKLLQKQGHVHLHKRLL